MFQKNKAIFTFFAYRLPGQQEVHYFKGETTFNTPPGDIITPGFIFHSFSGDQVLQVKNALPILPGHFTCHILPESGEKIWTETEYNAAFEKVMQEISSGTVEKIVLSRLKPAKTDRNPLEIFDAINQTYLNTFNYIISNEQTGTWVGATPELLLDLSHDQLSTVSLAGTRPANGFVAWTDKERKEQQYVTDFIIDTLKKNECTHVLKSGPSTLTAGPVQHLKTEIAAVCSNTKTLNKILADLHPTPATCGIPKSIAKEKITTIEAHHRKFYTGYIGLVTEHKKTFFVNLRCMEIQQKRALLYVGGGITAESVAEKEWDETERKAVTLLNVLH